MFGHFCISSKKIRVSPSISGSFAMVESLMRISLLSFASSNNFIASGISTKFISTKLLNDLPNLRMEYVFPTCLAPVISRALREVS